MTIGNTSVLPICIRADSIRSRIKKPSGRGGAGISFLTDIKKHRSRCMMICLNSSKTRITLSLQRMLTINSSRQALTKTSCSTRKAITACSNAPCRVMTRLTTTMIMVRSTTKENVDSIFSSMRLKSWNLLSSEKMDWEQKPIGALLGDIEDFSNYVMLSGFSQNNEIITASKANKAINTDINQSYIAGARFYSDAQKLAQCFSVG